jgi:stage V sporulation protein SpoVS
MEHQGDGVKREEFVLRVANVTDVHRLATAIRKNMEEQDRVVLSCVGVTTVNSAVKATAIANGTTASHGYVFQLLPYFASDRDKENPNLEHTVMRFVVKKVFV